jgi:DNA repair photolyase
MKIISASRREDMPAFDMLRLLEKYEEYDSDTFWALWTKNPHNILLNYTRLDPERTALQLTVTGLGGTMIERNVPLASKVWEDVEQLIKSGFSPALINWRMDPIIPGIHTPKMVHSLAKRASGLGINRCTISFVTFYEHVKTRWPEGLKTYRDPAQQREIGNAIKDILGGYGIILYGCAQPHLRGLIMPSKCIDGEYYSAVTGFTFDTEKDPSQRKACGCTKSVDIGRYRAGCVHNCRYCYATSHRGYAQAEFKASDN